MNTKILKGASILSAILMVSMLFSTVLAGPVQPFNRWGYANDSGGADLPDGTDLYSWIDGVSYGMDTTTGGNGLFSIDTYGDDTTPDAVKTGGYNGDTVFYSIGDLTTSGTFFAETDSWVVGGFNTLPADLNEVPASPALLKINNVASQSGFAIDDYVVVYNPSGAAVDLTLFSLDIGGAGPAPILAGMVCPDSTNPVAPGTWCALDLTGLLSTTGNSITLSESASGFIVDRVEYGAIPAEPENTMMPNAPNPAAAQEIYRVPVMGADTNDCLVDFTIGPAVDHGGIVAPFITITDPFDGELNVPITRNVVITFSEPMVPASVTYTCAPDPGGWVPAWSMGDTVLTLTHTDFAYLTLYTFTVTGGVDVNDGLGLVAGPVPNPFTFTTEPMPGGITPWDIACHRSGPDILIDWTTGVGPFDVYIADTVSGAGPFVLLAGGVAGMNYLHPGAVGDGLSHSYYVTADGGVTKSNLGFKLINPLTDVGLATNWIGLPYKCDITTADQLMDDVNIDNGGVNAVNVATQWDRGLQGYQSRTELGAMRIGINFAIQAGHGYQLKMFTGQPVVWNVIGAAADVDSVTYLPIPLTTALTDVGLATNWFALPYNTVLANADAVMDEINADGPGGNAVNVLTQWDRGLQGYQSRTELGAMRIGINFAIQPGQGYQAKMFAGFPVTFILNDDVLLP
jgi:hypothetical protein